MGPASSSRYRCTAASWLRPLQPKRAGTSAVICGFYDDPAVKVRDVLLKGPVRERTDPHCRCVVAGRGIRLM